MSPLHSSKIKFTGHGGTPYQFLPQHGASTAECYGYENGMSVCTFESMSLNAGKLHIEHFAVSKTMIGKNYGEICLRDFAAMVQAQMPIISEITFDLGRSLTGSDIAQLAKARESLLKRIGAINICIRQSNASCKVVSAAWQKSAW